MFLSKMKFIFAICILFLSIALSGTNSEEAEQYDFIIVGGGTAGCVVASRLSENGKHTVLILEKGVEPTNLMNIPAVSQKAAVESGIWKKYFSAPQTNATLENGGIAIVHRGETLGGTSAINGMNFNRGHPYDYDNWANITGDDSWSYSKLLQKYFKKLENYTGDFPLSDQHGVGGPISVSTLKFAPGLQLWLEAGKELGYPVADPNGPQKGNSVGPIELAIKNGHRVSSYSGYLQPVLGYRLNLKILTNAQVDKIVFNESKAVGVKYTIANQTWLAFATKEIIISSGFVGSPVLLMKSGIGPKGVLDHANIKTVKELPVGRNLRDHQVIRLGFGLNSTAAVIDPDRDLTPENLRVYSETGNGPYSNPFGQTSQAFLMSPKSQAQNWPDIHVITYYSPEHAPKESTAQLRDGEVVMSANVFVSRPKSVGVLTLNSTDINGVPNMDFRYLTHPDDVDVLIYAIKTTLKIFENTTAHQRVATRWIPSPVPKCDHLKFRSDDYWRCYVSQKASSGNHGVGTCKMGRHDDLEAVVDPTLKVIGIQGLRVVDASVMPVVTNANTMAPIYVIAEKASDMILREWEAVKI